MVAAIVAATLPVAAQTVSTIPVGADPIAVAVNSATDNIYVVNELGNSVSVLAGATNGVTTVPTGAGPDAVAVNAASNMIYIANGDDNTVTVIDGVSNSTSTVNVGRYPVAIAVNAVTNKIYVANYASGTVTVIDGATNNSSNITAGYYPCALAVNSTANTVYVANCGNDTVTIIDGTTNTTTTAGVGHDPHAVAVNAATNKAYVVDSISNDVAVIDGATQSVTIVAVGAAPDAVAADAVHNQIYVTDAGQGATTVIDGATLTTSTVIVGGSPAAVDVNPTTNQAYVANGAYEGAAIIIDGATHATTPLTVGHFPMAVAVNSVTNTIYVVNSGSNSVSVISWTAPPPPPPPAGTPQFVPATPCRVVDTRLAKGPFGGPAIAGGASRSFAIPAGACNIPGTVIAYSLNVTVVPPSGGTLGYLTIWPTDQQQPVVSTLNSLDGRVKANAALIPAGTNGAVSVFASNTTDVVLDIDGYFQTPSSQTLQFYPLSPCRVLDTRNASGDLGGPALVGQQERDFPVLSSACQIPSNAQAYSMNFTVVPVGGTPLGYLTVWPVGQSQPLVSTLNNPTATIVANAAIVPAGAGGAIAVYADQNTQLIADISGYFAAPGSGGLGLYPVTPCRVLDTRQASGGFSGELEPPVDVSGSSCAIPSSVQAYVFNVTVVPAGALGYLTLWPDGDDQPLASTLNAVDGAVTSNMAIVGNQNGKTNAYASGTTQLVVDISSYFAP
ncbi:MAG TPA: YncE family protein [Candidatus Binatia bacterium]|nr:YncE family protein [Candidatus Binatia bacterium]